MLRIVTKMERSPLREAPHKKKIQNIGKSKDEYFIIVVVVFIIRVAMTWQKSKKFLFFIFKECILQAL